jgi:alpha-beta hydrolase superfamily lysophospholipase
VTWLALRADAVARARAAGWGWEPLSPLELVEQVAAPWYGVPARELARRASAAEWPDDLRAPTLLVHAVDDVVVPVAQVRRFAALAARNPQVRVVVRPTGRHTLFEALDPAWMRDVELAWLGSWARRPVR